MNLLGFEIDAEVSVSGGRVDAVLELGDKVYVMEFKHKACEPDAMPDVKQNLFEKALEDGMAQIRSRGGAPCWHIGKLPLSCRLLSYCSE